MPNIHSQSNVVFVPTRLKTAPGSSRLWPAPQANFEKFITEFANHLHNRYLLRFEPKDPHPGLHEVRVRLGQAENNVVLARRSYWVNEPEATKH